jgi:hypothetical protein
MLFGLAQPTRTTTGGRHELKVPYGTDSRFAKTIRENKTSVFGTSKTGLESEAIDSLRLPNTGWVDSTNQNHS